jgi:cytoskeletal protein CcmA (bactofilin family)
MDRTARLGDCAWLISAAKLIEPEPFNPTERFQMEERPMWNKQSEPELSSNRPVPATNPVATPSIATTRPSAPTARNLSCLGSSIQIKGSITGSEDLQIDGKVEGPISLPGQKLTVGNAGRLNSEVSAREVVVYGNLSGNIVVQDRVEIKKDASVTGDVRASRISIEDGAYFKGRIEIDRAKPFSSSQPETVPELVGAATN